MHPFFKMGTTINSHGKFLFILYAFFLLYIQGIQPLFSQVKWKLHTTLPGMNLKGLTMFSPEKGWLGVYNGSKTVHPFFRLEGDEWQQDTTFPMDTYRTFVVDALGPDHIWVCGYAPEMTDSLEDMGRLYLFDGVSWHLKAKGVSWAKCMNVVARNELWIGFNGGAFLHLWDDGYALITLDLPPDILKVSHIYDMRMLNQEEGWACGAHGLLAHYKEAEWQIIPPSPQLAEILFEGIDTTEDGSVWLAGEQGSIARYNKGEWTHYSIPGAVHLFAIDMVSRFEGWCVGEKGTILFFSDGQWLQQPSPTFNTLTDIQMLDAGTGWISGGPVILKTVKGDFNIFRDITRIKNRIMNFQPANSASALDLDGNAHPDIFFMGNRIFRNNGKGIFFEFSDVSGLPVEKEGASAGEFAWGDVNNDGNLDLFQLGYYESDRCVIYENRGKGRFRLSNNTGDIREGGGQSSTAGFVDYDTDGDVDLYIAPPYARSQVPAEICLYENTGFGVFRRSKAVIKASAENDLMLWGDLDNDGDLDIVLLISFKVFLNDGQGNFTEFPESLAGIRAGMPVLQALLFDEDLDGDLDLFAVIDYPWLFRNDGKGFFDPEKGEILYDTKKSTNSQTSLCSLGDIDNDGFAEIFFTHYVEDKLLLHILKRQPGGIYCDLAPSLGFSGFTGIQLLLQDLDEDGDLDFYLANYQGNYNLHQENQTNNKQYLKIRARGAAANSFAVGAAIMIYAAGRPGEPEFLAGYQQVGVGLNPHSMSNLGYLHFGLPVKGMYDIKVRFPGGRVVFREGVCSGSTLDIFEYPAPERCLLLLGRQVQRALYFAVPWLEFCKLVLLAGFYLVLRLLPARRTGAVLFFRKWFVPVLLLPAYILVTVFLAGNDFLISHILPVSGFLLFLAGSWLLDTWFSLRRKSRYVGHYRLGVKLGEGGMGIVYRARNIITRQNAALKVLHPGLTAEENHKQRFAREGKLMESLDHPHIVRVFETGEISGRAYISMELLAGKTLGALIREHGKLELPLLARLLLPVCSALGYIHSKGIIHRDIKSDNIFLVDVPDKRGNNTPLVDMGIPYPVRLMDFGLARDVSLLTMTRARGLIGTVAYMSPEQARGEPVDSRTDLFSLGVIIYEALTGRLPFRGEHEVAVLQAIFMHDPEPVSSLQPGLSCDVDNFLAGLLAKKREKRYTDIEEVKQALLLLLDKTSAPAPAAADSALSLSCLGLEKLGSGEYNEALEFSSRAVNLVGQDSGDAKNVFFNHYRVLKSLGQEGQAAVYIEKAYNSLLETRENFPNDKRSRDIFEEYKIRELTRDWQLAYDEAVFLQAGNNTGAAYLRLRECINTVYEVLFFMQDEEKKQEYIARHDIEKIILLKKRLAGAGE